MNAEEFLCAILGMPVLIGVTYYCIEYGHFKLLLLVLLGLSIVIPAYFSLARYEAREFQEAIIMRQNCDFLHKREQTGDSLRTITICNYINSYEKDQLYQPQEQIRILYLKNGNHSVFSKRRCFVSDSPFVQFVKISDSEGYTVDLLQYVDVKGDTVYHDTYNNRSVQLKTFRVPAYYIDPTIYLY